jgi:hypothetical protein
MIAYNEALLYYFKDLRGRQQQQQFVRLSKELTEKNFPHAYPGEVLGLFPFQKM